MLQRSACAGIEPRTSRRMTATRFVQLTADCANVLPRSGNADVVRRWKSALSSCLKGEKQRLREMGSGQERQLTKEEMEAREAAGSAATRRCVRRPRLQRARCDFVDFFRCTPRDLGAIGHGAPPQARWHLVTVGDSLPLLNSHLAITDRYCEHTLAAFCRMSVHLLGT